MKVLIVDDSIVFRSQIKLALEGEDNIEVVGVANNGSIAMQKLKQHKVDLVTLDLEMPVMNGIETLKAIKELKYDLRIIMFSSQTTSGSQATLDALALGAEDFVAKPTGENISFENASDVIKGLLLPKVKQFLSPTVADKSSIKETRSIKENGAEVQIPAFVKKDLGTFRPDVMLIGSSTGGPPALEKVFAKIKAPVRCPILICQHMPPVFTQSLAKRIEKITGVEAAEGIDGEVLKNRIYVSPGDYHMTLEQVNDQKIIKLNQGPQINMVRPAVDPLFESVSKIFGHKTMAMILTGMGDDGKDGCIAVKQEKGGVLIQNKGSCVVYGMPRAVFEAEAFDEEGDLNFIQDTLTRMVA